MWLFASVEKYVFKCVFFVNVLLHFKQACRISQLWINLWVFKLPTRQNVLAYFEQTWGFSHETEYGFTPVWIHSCLFKVPYCVNVLSHFEQPCQAFFFRRLGKRLSDFSNNYGFFCCFLKKHEVIYTGEKPHVCSKCEKTFTQKAYLKTHELILTGKKPHGCSKCDKTFTQKGTLKRHELIHTGVKPHSVSWEASCLLKMCLDILLGG